jgi:hypothetical protein
VRQYRERHIHRHHSQHLRAHAWHHGGGDQQQHQRCRRHRQQAQRWHDSPGQTGCGRFQTCSQRRQQQRDDDQPQERTEKRPRPHQPGRRIAQQQAQIHRQHQHLQDQQGRGRRQQQPRIRPPEMRKGDDIIDARRQQHQQHPQAQHRLVRQELHQPRHQHRHRHEIGHHQRREEPQPREGLPQLPQRHLQEGDEQHESQRGIDAGLQRLRPRHQDPAAAAPSTAAK